jgi:hypothetical protein
VLNTNKKMPSIDDLERAERLRKVFDYSMKQIKVSL